MSAYGSGAYGLGIYGGALGSGGSGGICLTGQDRTTYVTPDGVEYMLSSPLFILQEDGYGMPPIEYVTQRGPFQHGETVKDFFLRPRVLQLIVRRNGTSRADYWDIRNTLLGILRPGRLGVAPGTLRKYLANGAVRELSVHVSEGPGFPSHDPNIWDQWSIQDTIRFTAYDPVAKDPAQQLVGFASSGVVGAFPITFPWQIAAFGSGPSVVNYDATWLTYPIIILNGPLTGPVLRNITTDEKIQLNYTVASGRVVTIDLSYGHKTATLDDGTNLLGYVSSDSDVGSFHLEPGPNQLQVTATGTSAISSVQLQYLKRYVGF